jgi:serine-type D-Ala-D-Ala carboxypeptidase (penicillin-binding protein 5/6)
MNSSVSRMFLGVGQRVPVNDLLYGLMVSSGNDAAIALAEYLGGSSDGFTEQMNRQAQKLGLNETHFENPDGLPAPGMYTTASDPTVQTQAGRLQRRRRMGVGLRHGAHALSPCGA